MDSLSAMEVYLSMHALSRVQALLTQQSLDNSCSDKHGNKAQMR